MRRSSQRWWTESKRTCLGKISITAASFAPSSSATSRLLIPGTVRPPMTAASELDQDYRLARQLGRTWPAFFERFGRLTAVQRAAIPAMLAGHDVLVRPPPQPGRPRRYAHRSSKTTLTVQAPGRFSTSRRRALSSTTSMNGCCVLQKPSDFDWPDALGTP